MWHALQAASDEMNELVSGVYAKILKMTESEWAATASILPLATPYGEGDCDSPNDDDIVLP